MLTDGVLPALAGRCRKAEQADGTPFAEMGRYYAGTGYFDKQTVDQFAAPEYLPEKEIRMFNRVGRPVQRVFMGRMAKNWAAGSARTRSLTRTGASENKGTPPAVCPHFLRFGKKSREKFTVYI